jgi:hypothetical protein
MAAPNIVNVSFIAAKTSSANVTVTPTALVSNSLNSSQVYKINHLLATNANTSPADITVDLYRTSTSYPLAYTITVPEKSTVVILGKDTAIYLEEGDSMRVWASANAYLYATTSYEILS